jgi:hypothetical protein
MSNAASNYLENKLLDHTLRHASAPYVGVTTVYCALFSGAFDPTVQTALESGTSSTSGSGNWGFYEITGNAYARQAITFGTAAASGSISNTGSAITFDPATGDYNNTATSGSTVTALAIMDQPTGGNVLFYGALTVPKQVSSGDQFTISTGNLTVQLA